MADATRIDGPRFGPAAGGEPDALVVLLHGWGADGNDLVGLAPYMARALPHARFVSPHAPEPCDANPMGRQWFPLMERSADQMLLGAQSAAPAIDAFLDAELAGLGLGDERLALVGFSQGTMMALHVAPRRPQACAAVVGYSGRLIAPERLEAELRVRPPVMLIHGEDDPLVLVALLDDAVGALSKAGFAVEWHRRPHLQHSIDETGLSAGTEFIQSAFAGA